MEEAQIITPGAQRVLERTDEMMKLEIEEQNRQRFEALKAKEAREKRTLEIVNLLDEMFDKNNVTWAEFADALNALQHRTNSVMGGLKISEIKESYD